MPESFGIKLPAFENPLNRYLFLLRFPGHCVPAIRACQFITWLSSLMRQAFAATGANTISACPHAHATASALPRPAAAKASSHSLASAGIFTCLCIFINCKHICSPCICAGTAGQSPHGTGWFNRCYSLFLSSRSASLCLSSALKPSNSAS